MLRLASWDLRERFRATMEERSIEVRAAETGEARAEKAKEWFVTVVGRSEAVRERVEAIGVKMNAL